MREMGSVVGRVHDIYRARFSTLSTQEAMCIERDVSHSEKNPGGPTSVVKRLYG